MAELKPSNSQMQRQKYDKAKRNMKHIVAKKIKLMELKGWRMEKDLKISAKTCSDFDYFLIV